MAKKKKIILRAAAVAAPLALAAWAIWGNTALELNRYIVSSVRLPARFDGCRIAHISDLHNAEMGRDNEKLLSMLRKAGPDMIVITGDMIDARNTNIGIALEFARSAMQIAPCYYVTGNHESRIKTYHELKNGLEAAGVMVLEDARAEICREGETVTLIGVNDPRFHPDYQPGEVRTVMDASLTQLCRDTDGFTILLSHRPELFDLYAEHGIDLVFSGHAHGGQFRIPLIGGMFAPDQGFFPEYDAGLYTRDNTSMLVSRGIGKSRLPLRINNRPEVILVELRSES